MGENGYLDTSDQNLIQPSIRSSDLDFLQYKCISATCLRNIFNVLGVVTCSDNSTCRLVTCSLSLDLFSIHFVSTLHSSIAATSASQYKKKLKLNKMLTILVISCNFMSCNFMPCNFDGPSYLCPSFSAPPPPTYSSRLRTNFDHFTVIGF